MRGNSPENKFQKLAGFIDARTLNTAGGGNYERINTSILLFILAGGHLFRVSPLKIFPLCKNLITPKEMLVVRQISQRVIFCFTTSQTRHPIDADADTDTDIS